MNIASRLSDRRAPIHYERVLSNIAKRQRKALQQLYEAEAESMMVLARHALGHEESAQQVLIDTYLAIWSHAGSYDADIGSAKGWVYSVLRYQLRQYYHQHYDRLAAIHRDSPPFAAMPLCEVRVERDEGIELETFFCHHFEQLAKEQQDAVLTTYISPDSQAAVASRMGLSLHKLKEDLSVALHHLGRSLPHLSEQPNCLLLGEYVLGGLSEGELLEVDQVMQHTVDSTAIILQWETYFTELIAQLKPVSLDKAFWKSITEAIKRAEQEQKRQERLQYQPDYVDKTVAFSQRLDAVTPDAAADGATDETTTANPQDTQRSTTRMPWRLRLYFWWHSATFWQLLSGVAVALLLLVLLWPNNTSQTRWIAVLTDRSANATAAWVMQVQSSGDATIQAQYQQLGQPQFNLQLWTSTDGGVSLIPLMPLAIDRSNRITADRLGTVSQNQQMYISLEPRDRPVAQRPTGSILFQGPLIDLNAQDE